MDLALVGLVKRYGEVSNVRGLRMA